MLPLCFSCHFTPFGYSNGCISCEQWTPWLLFYLFKFSFEHDPVWNKFWRVSVHTHKKEINTNKDFRWKAQWSIIHWRTQSILSAKKHFFLLPIRILANLIRPSKKELDLSSYLKRADMAVFEALSAIQVFFFVRLDIFLVENPL